MGISVREFVESLRKEGLSPYEAMDRLDEEAVNSGYWGFQFYPIIDQVYAEDLTNAFGYDDWQPPKQKRKTRKVQHTKQEWEEQKERYGYRCFYCGKKTRLTKDHVIPISKGGNDKIENIVPACWPCNFKKRAKAITEFKEGAMLKLI